MIRCPLWCRDEVAQLVQQLRGSLCPDCTKSAVTVFPAVVLESDTRSGRAVLVPFWCPKCHEMSGVSYSEGLGGAKLEQELIRAWTAEWPRRQRSR